MRGAYTSEQINQKLADVFNYNYKELWQGFVHDCKTMHVRPETLDLIKKVRVKYKVILLTDNMDCFDRFTVPSLMLDTCFDRIINSYNYGVVKADANAGLFKHVNEDCFRDTVLIDNSKKNCHVFDKLGGKSHLVDLPTDIDKFLERLI